MHLRDVNKNIFRRHACAYESAALNNPNRDIFIVFLSPFGLDLNYDMWPQSLRALMEYPNIYFRNLRLEDMFANTILEKWSGKDELYDPKFSHQLNDLARIMILFKYGGTCLDSDYLILKSLHPIGYNWISSQDSEMILDFRHYGFGHVIAHECLRYTKSQVKAHHFSFSLFFFCFREIMANSELQFQDRAVGHFLVLQTLRKVCNNTDLSDNITQKCNERLLLPEHTFHGITHDDADILSPSDKNTVLDRLVNVYGIRVWNFLENTERVDLRDGSALSTYFSRMCPIIQNKFEFI